MKKLFLFLSWTFLFTNAFAQPLSFSIIGSEPAYCRMFSYQSGNGVVYAAAQGGTPDYDYLLTNLTTGANVTNSTWGGLNPGLYKVQVTDNVGAILIDTVEVDSINPVADFYETWGNLNPAPFGYTGYFYENAKFVNTSYGVHNPFNPAEDTTYFWHRGISPGLWEITHDFYFSPEQGYSAGDYDVRLIAINKNGCTDTISKHIHIFGPVGIEEDSKTESFISIYGKPQQNILHFNCKGFSENMLVTIFSISGEVIMTFEAVNGINEFSFNAATGVYAYSVVGAASQNVIATGKLKY